MQAYIVHQSCLKICKAINWTQKWAVLQLWMLHLLWLSINLLPVHLIHINHNFPKELQICSLVKWALILRIILIIKMVHQLYKLYINDYDLMFNNTINCDRLQHQLGIQFLWLTKTTPSLASLWMASIKVWKESPKRSLRTLQ